jgi:hypothetical protein
VQIKEIRDISGSHIKILPPDELPPCALSNDRVVQCVYLRRQHSFTLMPEEGQMPPLRLVGLQYIIAHSGAMLPATLLRICMALPMYQSQMPCCQLSQTKGWRQLADRHCHTP